MKIIIDLEMPMERPQDAPLCEECSMKHHEEDDCWEGILPAGMLDLPKLDRDLTGRELIDTNPGSEKKNMKVAMNVRKKEKK